jgi:hypothetical protein
MICGVLASGSDRISDFLCTEKNSNSGSSFLILNTEKAQKNILTLASNGNIVPRRFLNTAVTRNYLFASPAVALEPYGVPLHGQITKTTK